MQEFSSFLSCLENAASKPCLFPQILASRLVCVCVSLDQQSLCLPRDEQKRGSKWVPSFSSSNAMIVGIPSIRYLLAYLRRCC